MDSKQVENTTSLSGKQNNLTTINNVSQRDASELSDSLSRGGLSQNLGQMRSSAEADEMKKFASEGNL